MAYSWEKNFACTTVFAVMRSGTMLSQKTIPTKFSEAGDTKLKTLTYFPRTNLAPTLIDNQATIMSNMFVNHMMMLGVIASMEEEGTDPRKVKDALKDIFKDGEKTLKDIAQAIDDLIKFFDE